MSLIPYPNVPRTIGAVISAGKATMVELDTVLGVEDMYDLLEIIAIDAANSRLIRERNERT